MIKAGQSYLMLKIATPMDFSFEDEHKKIIDKDGYVWFCRFGKGNLKIESISESGNILFVKESVKNGGKRYMMEFSEISSSQPTSGYPDYYNTSDAPKDIWFQITSIKELDDSFEKSFCVKSSGGELYGVYRSMCNSFYITAKEDY